MNLLKRIFRRRRSIRSKEVAKSRLQVVLVHDRINMSPGMMEQLREDLADVISHYIEIDEEGLDIAVTNSHRQSELTAHVSVIGAAYQ